MTFTMEDSKMKTRGSNVITISNVISKLIHEIEKHAPLNEQEFSKLLELKVLKEKCCSENSGVSSTALQGLMKLVEKGIISCSHVMFILISLIPSVVHYSDLIFTIGDLLLLDLRQKVKNNGTYSCHFLITNPQHPLITILKYDQNKSWDSIYLFIQYVLYKNNDIEYDYKIELLNPLFLHIFCDPTATFLYIKNQFFSLLLEEMYQPITQTLMLEILSWQQLDISYCFFVKQTCEYLLRHSSAQSNSIISALTPSLALCITWLITNGYNPALWINTLESCLTVNDDAASAVLYLLADVILQTPALHLIGLVELCKSVIFKGSCNKYAAYKVLAAILNWMVNPSILIGDLSETVEDILLHLILKTDEWNTQSSKLLGNSYYNILRNSSSAVKMAVDMSKISDSWTKNKLSQVNWLKNLFASENYLMQQKLHLFVSGIIICEEDTEILEICLEMLLKLVDIYNNLSFSVLCLIFFKLSRESEPAMQMKYLLSLPKMAVEKENVPIIIGAISSLKNGNSRIMIPVVTRLNLTLWKIEGRTYPYLHEMLTRQSPPGDQGWEINVSKTLAMKEICRLKPELLGKDLVSMLSEVLNVSCNEESGLCSAIAIDSITELCKAYVIDIVGTWRALEPKLSRDKRQEVILSLCRMFGEVPALGSPEEKYEKLTHDVIAKLWSYICLNDELIAKAALKSLGKFKIESHELKLMPEMFRRGLTLPKEYAKTPVDAARRPEDVLPYIPGECWVQFLQKINPKLISHAGNMLIEMIERELESFPRGIFYWSPDKPEPSSYSYLTHKSIICALVAHVQKNCKDVSELPSTVEESLRILSHGYLKNLPPLDWSFLDNFINLDAKCSEYCIGLAAKQGPTSASAKHIIERFIMNHSCSKITDILFLYSILPRLCNSVQPNYLRPFIEKSLKLAVDIGLKENPESFKILVAHVKMTLQMENVHEANKTVLVLQMENILPLIPSSHEMMKHYADCAIEFPTKYIERISSPSLWWEVTNEKLLQAVVIRQTMALKSNSVMPLVWFNECIDAAGNFPDTHSYVLRSILYAIQKHRDNESNRKWLRELMGRTQASLPARNDFTDSLRMILNLLDIFLCSVIVLAGHDCLINDLHDIVDIRENKLYIFPNALAELFSFSEWSEILPQVIEWIHGLSLKNGIPLAYRNALQQSIKSLRFVKYCKDVSRWPRLFSFQKNL